MTFKPFSRTIALPAAVAASLCVAPAIATGQVVVGTTLGTTIGQVAVALENQNYNISEIEIDGNRIEAEVTLDNRDYEIWVDRNTGNVVSIRDD